MAKVLATRNFVVVLDLFVIEAQPKTAQGFFIVILGDLC